MTGTPRAFRPTVIVDWIKTFTRLVKCGKHNFLILNRIKNLLESGWFALHKMGR